MHFNTGASKCIACHCIDMDWQSQGEGCATALARSLSHASQHKCCSKQEVLCSKRVNHQLKQTGRSAEMQHLPISVEKQAAGAQHECGGWGRAHLICQLSQGESPQNHICPLQRQELTRTLASGWKTSVKQSSFRKEMKGGR